MTKITVVLAALLSALAGMAGEWELVWADEFDKGTRPNPETWSYEQGFVRNREAQYYTVNRKENVRVENGMLVIAARKEALPNPNYDPKKSGWKNRKAAKYTSGSIKTRGKAEWLYGRIEVRAKLPTGRGMWPAIWMLGRKGGWPACGEIDIMENVGYDPDVIHGNIHTAKYNHVKGTNKGNKIKIPKPYAAFHIYAVEWHPDRIDFFVDKKKYFTFKNEGTGEAAWPYDEKMYLILNIAVGGGWGGQKGIDDNVFPQRMYVDYVRVYQRKIGVVENAADKTPPKPPARLNVLPLAIDETRLSWQPAADDHGVQGYEVYRDGRKIGATIATKFSDSKPKHGVQHKYVVRTVDVGANRSGPSTPATAVASTNLVSNGGVELGVMSWRGWGKGKKSITENKVQVHSGSRALHAGANSGWGNYSIARHLKPGKRYRFTVWSKASAANAPWAGAGVQVRDTNGKRIIDEKVFKTTWTQWRRITHTFTVPEHFTEAYVFLWHNGPGDLYADDFVLEPVTE